MLETGGLTILSVVSIVILARYLSPREIGIAALALGVVQVLCMIVEMLFHDALVQRQNLTRRHVDSVFWTTTALGLLFTLLCWWIAAPMAALFDEPELAPVLSWMGLAMVFAGLGAAPLAVLRRDLRFRALTIRSLSGRVVGLVAAIGLAIGGFGVWALVAQQVLMLGVSCAVGWWMAKPRYRFGISLTGLAELAAFAFASVAALLISFSTVRVFTLLAGFFLGTTALGFINLAFRVVDTLRDVLEMVSNQVALPFFSRRQQDLSALGRAYYTATDFTCTLTVPLFAGLFITAPDLVVVVFGENWLPAVPYVQLLAILAVLHFPHLYAQSTLAALGYPRHNVSVNALAFVICAVGMLIFGPMGAAAAMTVWTARLVLSMPVRAALLHRVAQISIASQTRAALPSFTASGVMVTLLWLLHDNMLWNWPPIERLAAMVVTGGAIYAMTLLLVSPGSIPRLYQFLFVEMRKQKNPVL